MKIADNASIDDNTNGDGESAPRTGLTPDALPEVQEPVWAENLQSGVSTRNALSGSTLKTIKRKPKDGSHWYALRVTYGREKKVYDYLFGKHVEAYYPTIKTVKEVDGKRKTVEESRLPNILFTRGTEEEIKSFVYDNVNHPPPPILLPSLSRRSTTHQRASHRTRLPDRGSEDYLCFRG